MSSRCCWAVVPLVLLACSQPDPAGPGDGNTTGGPAEIPDLSGIWVVTQADNGSFQTSDAQGGDVQERASGECVMRASGGGPWRLVIVQDGSNATAEFPARQLSCEGEDTSPDTPAEGTVRLSETFEGFTVGVRFGGDGSASFVPHNTCDDAAFARDIVSACSWSESMSLTREGTGDIMGTFTVRLDYTVVSTRRSYEVIRGNLLAEWIGPPP